MLFWSNIIEKPAHTFLSCIQHNNMLYTVQSHSRKFSHELYIMIHNIETKLAFDVTFFACTVRTCLHIMQSQAIIIIYRFIKLFQHFMWCMSAVQRSCMPLIDEKMVFLPTETEKPWPIIAYNPMTITPTPLLNIWPWGLKCT